MDNIIGIISDTHGLLRPEALKELRGSSLILHAGDIGGGAILDELGKIAPVVAVRGNTDREDATAHLRATECIECGGKSIYLIHNIGLLDVDPKAAGIDVVVYGHSHQPSLQYKDAVLYLNPGSAGPRRFRLPVSAARLRVCAEGVKAELVELAVSED